VSKGSEIWADAFVTKSTWVSRVNRKQTETPTASLGWQPWRRGLDGKRRSVICAVYQEACGVYTNDMSDKIQSRLPPKQTPNRLT
jgi:hypothetical protein